MLAGEHFECSQGIELVSHSHAYRGGATGQVGQVKMLSFTVWNTKTQSWLQKILLQSIMYINSSMFAYTLLTEVYCQSATGVRNVVVFYYIRSVILFCLMHVIPAHG